MDNRIRILIRYGSFTFLVNVLFLHLLALSVMGATYYVSPTGSTSWPNCTTQASPCLADSSTPGKAFLGANAGDTVYFLPGTYNPGAAADWAHVAWNPTNSGSAGSPITFQCLHPLFCAILHNANGKAFGAQNVNYITWDGFTSTKVGAGPVVGLTGSDHAILRNCVLTGIYVSGGDNSPLVSGTAPTNALITNNYFQNNTGDSWNSAALLEYSWHGVTVQYNTFEGNTCAVFDKGGGVNNIYQFNFFINNTTAMLFGTDGGAGPIGEVVTQNVMAGSTGANIYINYNTYQGHDISIYNNTISANSVYGIIDFNDLITQAWNNVIAYTSPSYAYDGGRNPGQPTYIDYNIYYSGQQFTIKQNVAGTTTYATLALWQASGALLGGGHPDTHSYLENPHFANAGGTHPQDYKINATHKNNGRGGAYSSVIGAYITGNEQIGSSMPPQLMPPKNISVTN